MDFVDVFIQELLEKGQQSIELIKSYLQEKEHAILNELYRLFHTIKGSASLVGFSGFKELFHFIEEFFKRQTAGEEVLTDDVLARILSVMPELLKKNTDLSDEELEKYKSIIEGKSETTSSVASVATEAFPIEILQELLSKTLSAENSLMRTDTKNALREVRILKSKLISMVENSYYVKLKKLLANFNALVLQEATLNKKKVRLNLELGEEHIEKKDSQMLIDMLVHLVRNAIAHGIESPEVRIQRRKSEVGTITLRSYIRGSELYLEIEDDGNGIDFEKIRKKAAEKNLSHLRPEDVIFVPGFSTKEQADGTSGRGIGLDVVKNFSTARGGDVELVTSPGKGTKFIVHFPVKSFLVRVIVASGDGTQFCIDSRDVLEVVSQPRMANDNNEKIVHKSNLYDIAYACQNPRFGIITNSGKAILVDNILGIFDGQISNESYGAVKGFVKNIFVYPLPIIAPESFTKVLTKQQDTKRILIVDDSVVTRTIVSKFLKNFGYKTIEASSGIEALEVIKKSSPDAVICDVEMPGIDGFEVTKRIKEQKPKIPVILFSTLTHEQLAKGLEVGADAYISKDEPPERLLRLIEKLIRES